MSAYRGSCELNFSEDINVIMTSAYWFHCIWPSIQQHDCWITYGNSIFSALRGLMLSSKKRLQQFILRTTRQSLQIIASTSSFSLFDGGLDGGLTVYLKPVSNSRSSRPSRPSIGIAGACHHSCRSLRPCLLPLSFQGSRSDRHKVVPNCVFRLYFSNNQLWACFM